MKINDRRHHRVAIDVTFIDFNTEAFRQCHHDIEMGEAVPFQMSGHAGIGRQLGGIALEDCRDESVRPSLDGW